MSHSTLANTIVMETNPKAMSQEVWPAIQPIKGGEIASPSAWIKKIFSANAVERIREDVTLASAVFAGPVLKKRKNTAPNTAAHAYGNGSEIIPSVRGKASAIAAPDIAK